MADLLVHLATVYVPARMTVRDPGVRALACLGVCLPDLITRAGLLFGVPGGTGCHDIVHTPAFQLLLCYALSLLFEQAWRKTAVVALFLGSLGHLALDAAKDFLGRGGIMWGYPFTQWRGGIALYVPEHTVYFMAPALLAILLVAWISRVARRRALRAAEVHP